MEIWKPLRNFPSYNGSSEGRIMNVKTQHILKPTIYERGYYTVCLRKNNQQYSVRLHKIIAETFLGDQPGMDVRHKDGDRSNNCVENLYWTTRSETIKDAYKRGSKKPYQCRPIRVLETGKVYNSIKECAEATGCDRSQISKYFAGSRPHVKGFHFLREDVPHKEM